MISTSRLLAALRQRSFPPEFRIDVDSDAWELPLVTALSGAIAASRGHLPASAVEPDTTAVAPKFVVTLCNELYRLRRNAEQMGKEGGETKELRSIRRVLEHLDELFEEFGIECRDLAGEVYHEGREDFDPISEAEVEPGIDRKRISRCERPLVLLDGIMLQRAKGLVVRPA